MNGRQTTRWATIVTLALLGGACGDTAATPGPTRSLGVADVLGGTADGAAGFLRATTVPTLHFPRDHGAHPGFRTEWWYITGNLTSEAGRRFGVQLVFFRQALAPPLADGSTRAASLAAREVILAHAAVTDVDGKRFFAEEQLARAAAGVALVRGPEESSGAAEPFVVACGNWSARAEAGGDGFLPMKLKVAAAEFAFTLQLGAGKPPVLQGDRGLSQKSGEAGNASIYYSLTRVPIGGTIAVGDPPMHQVQGEAWIDREWSTAVLDGAQIGWDWFSLQLDNGEDLMWYRLRRRDGGHDPWSRGCLVARDGTARPLLPTQVEAIPDGQWVAADGRARYPARWRLRASEPAFDLLVEPLLADQELRVLVRYWEGAVAVRGTRGGAAVTGRGYVEMTGYATAR